MEIKISRHARRRMNLYHIDESDVIATIRQKMTGDASEGKRMVAINRGLSSKYEYPLKVVYSQQAGDIIVVSAYPVRKEKLK